MISKITKQTKTEIELEIKVDSTEFNSYISKTLEKLGVDLEVKGFRKGKAPLNVVEETVGEQRVLMEAADLAVNESYKKAIAEHKIEAIFYPNIEVKNLKKGEDFIYTARTAVLPEIDLPDYKKIASKTEKKSVTVDDKEIEQAMNWLRKTRAKMTIKNEPAQKGDFVQIEYILSGKDANPLKDNFILGEGRMLPGFEDQLVGMRAGDEKKGIELDSNGKKFVVDVKMVSVQDMELPEINNEFAKSLGKFSNVDSLKNSVKEGIEREKNESEVIKARNEILENIMKETKTEIPATLVENEQRQMLEQLKKQIEQGLKMSFEDYLKSVKKSEEEILKSLKEEAEKKVKRYLILREIGKENDIEVKDEESINKIFKLLEE